MKLYSDFAAARTRQIVADVIAIVTITVLAWLGSVVFTLINAFSQWGADIENAGAGFRDTMVEVGETLGGVPLIGGGIRAPFDQASGAGEALESAGQGAQAAVHQFAVVAGVTTALLPTLLIVLIWLLPRLRFARRATAAQRLVDAGAPTELLAFRALANRAVVDLERIDANVVAAWRDGDKRVTRQLAALELRASGVRL